MRRKILHLIETLGQHGGTPRKLKLLFQELRSSQILSEIAYFLHVPDKSSEQAFVDCARVHRLKGENLWSLMRSFNALVRKVKPNVICTHFVRSLVVGATVAKVHGIPVVHYEHGPATLRSFKSNMLVGAFSRLSKRVVSNSAYTQMTVLSRCRVSGGIVEFTHNPVAPRYPFDCPNPEKMAPMLKWRSQPDSIVLGHVGGLIGWRRHDILLQAIALLRDSGQDVRLAVVGDGPQKSMFCNEQNRLGLLPYTKLLGYIEDVGLFLSLIDLYINPALEEGFGIANVEAMLSETPVVLANAGAHPELLPENCEFLLYDGRSPESLAKTISNLIRIKTQWKTIGEELRRHAEVSFSPSAYALHHANLVECLPPVKP